MVLLVGRGEMRRINHVQRDAKHNAQAGEDEVLPGLQPACEFLPEVLRVEALTQYEVNTIRTTTRKKESEH